jgi:hypothetical protein
MNSAIDFDLSSPELVPGERLGVWRLQRPLSEVPSGRWWRATHSLGGQAALVLVYLRAEDAGAVLLRMAHAEGQGWSHPDIAWPLDSGLTADGRPYVVTPLLDGEPLLQATATASLRRRLDWVMQLCELLLLARAQGLALVELDPSLLWVGPQQQLRLFGLALVPTDAQALRLGALQGQLSAAAQALHCPQALQGKPGGAQAQVYSVGMLMCMLANGRLPNDASPTSATVQVLTQWVSLSTASRAALDALLREAVQADPAQRPADLDQLAAGIEAWLEQSGASAGTGAGPLGPAEPRVVAAAPAETQCDAQDEAEPSLPRRPADAPPVVAPAQPVAMAPRWVLAALVLAALALAAWLALRA